MEIMELQIAIASVRGSIQKDMPLEDRISDAMRYVRKHERDIFWMSHAINDDARLRTAIGAVMVEGSEDERHLIAKSMVPLQALSAALSGIPVDLGAMDLDGIIPIMKLWNESAKQ